MGHLDLLSGMGVQRRVGRRAVTGPRWRSQPTAKLVEVGVDRVRGRPEEGEFHLATDRRPGPSRPDPGRRSRPSPARPLSSSTKTGSPTSGSAAIRSISASRSGIGQRRAIRANRSSSIADAGSPGSRSNRSPSNRPPSNGGRSASAAASSPGRAAPGRASRSGPAGAGVVFLGEVEDPAAGHAEDWSLSPLISSFIIWGVTVT